ncbi:sensor histidine kinase [Catelliglobosispora koreensis]|uniref:sensor histidine kinase n=1 Tax=Catelliglobosispora koreensis TaxID=129052 RepID=UPI00035D9EAF|nr:HAMP domain-containing sensor histidine kinase [Catelliglobosispora koreensis]
MSFRVRVLALIMLVTVLATGATAWLTWRTATQQVQRTVTAGAQDIQHIATSLVQHGRDHETWQGIEPVVSDLATQTGQRIRLVTESGSTIADSDELAGRPARAVTGAPLVIDPRPVLQLPAVLEPGGVASMHPRSGIKITASAISSFLQNHRLKQCLLNAGAAMTTASGPYGMEVVQASVPSVASRMCDRNTETSAGDFSAYITAATPCETLADKALRDCLQQAFLTQIATVTPEPLRVYIGASEDRPAAVPVAPIAAAASGVALIALLGMLLLSRRVLQPVRALTSAANQLGQGRLGDRVPVNGRDELAQLSQAFNRMAQALQDSEERQRRMTADIAHELRTPLTNLRGYLEALTDGTAAPSKELFLSLREEALLQQRIIDDLQDLALAEAGQLRYRHERIDLAELAETYPPQHFAPGISIVARSNGPAYVDGDLDRLRQAIGNLVRNAVAACGARGRIVLTVSNRGDGVELTVSDTGSGIAEADLPHVFDRFWRANRARPRGSGSGLGLAIVRQIVSDHGGTVDVSSALGQGTTFRLRLPSRQRIHRPS